MCVFITTVIVRSFDVPETVPNFAKSDCSGQCVLRRVHRSSRDTAKGVIRTVIYRRIISTLAYLIKPCNLTNPGAGKY
jgi:hypothetical protein